MLAAGDTALGLLVVAMAATHGPCFHQDLVQAAT